MTKLSIFTVLLVWLAIPATMTLAQQAPFGAGSIDYVVDYQQIGPNEFGNYDLVPFLKVEINGGNLEDTIIISDGLVDGLTVSLNGQPFSVPAQISAPDVVFGGNLTGAFEEVEIKGLNGRDTIIFRADPVGDLRPEILIEGGNGSDVLRSESSLTVAMVGGPGNDIISTGYGPSFSHGGSGFDILYSGQGNNTLDGGLNDDVLYGGQNDTKLFGGKGNDRIYGGPKNDYLSGGEGDDELFGNNGEDHLVGGTGNDELSGGLGIDLLEGDDGDDTLRGSDGDDGLLGGIGNDKLYGGNGDDSLVGNAGVDLINGGNGSNHVVQEDGQLKSKAPTGSGSTTYFRDLANILKLGMLGTSAQDRCVVSSAANGDILVNLNGKLYDPRDALGFDFHGFGADDTFIMQAGMYTDSFGGEGDDHMVTSIPMNGFVMMDGGNGDNLLIGPLPSTSIDLAELKTGDGKDTIICRSRSRASSGGGHDLIYGSDSNDWINGGPGNDTIYGKAGNDFIRGWTGTDVINGGDGDDNIQANGGNDIVQGGNGNDKISGGDGLDSIVGGNGNDEIDGGISADDIQGAAGNDTIHAGPGDDIVRGGDGDDTIFGEGGNDQIFGNQGTDTLSGGPGTNQIIQ